VASVEPVINLNGVPDWALLFGAGATVALFLYTAWWISSPPARRGLGTRTGIAVALFAVYLVRNLHARPMLWFTVICTATLVAWLAWMGPMPGDMPGATDPRCRVHPEYPRVARRGRIAGLAWITTSAALIIATLVWIKRL